MQITAEMVRDLREKTGAGMMDCKKALTEAGGDMEKANEILRKKGLAAAAKKAGRLASEGSVAVSVDAGAGALVEINCETDFVAKTDDFLALAAEVASLVREKGPADADAALALLVDGATLADRLTERVAKIGEKISLRRLARFAVPAGRKGLVSSYVHMGGKIGVLVELSGVDASNDEAKQLGKDIAMQVAASNPTYTRREEVPAEVLDKEREIYKVQALQQGKPEAIVAKIAEGRLEKYYGDFCLVDLLFFKDDKKKISDLLKEMSKAAGAPVDVVRFVRYQVGEGMEKRTDDLAAEVAKTLGQG
jgi:elongation factor Ts